MIYLRYSLNLECKDASKEKCILTSDNTILPFTMTSYITPSKPRTLNPQTLTICQPQQGVSLRDRSMGIPHHSFQPSRSGDDPALHQLPGLGEQVSLHERHRKTLLPKTLNPNRLSHCLTSHRLAKCSWLPHSKP